jgi:hypothetical protein
VGRLGVITPAEHLTVPINPSQGLAVGQRDVEPHRADVALEPAVDRRQQRLAPLSGQR